MALYSIVTIGAFAASPMRADSQTTGAAGAALPGWQLVYGSDSTGRALHGIKSRLRDAVRAGRPIRVRWEIPWRRPNGQHGVLEHVADAAFLTIHHDEVFAQLAPIMRQRPSADSASVQLDTAGTWVGMLDTTGRLSGVFPEAGQAPSVRVRTWWYASSSQD
jgi:hypothetical protein